MWEAPVTLLCSTSCLPLLFSEDAPPSIDSTPERLPGSGFSAQGQETQSLQGCLGAAGRQLVSCFLGTLCVCFFPGSWGHSAKKNGGGVIFSPQLLPSSPSLQSGLPVKGREGGGRWRQHPVTTPLPPACPAPSHCLSSPPRRKENGSGRTRAVIADLALLLPDRAQPSPARSH